MSLMRRYSSNILVVLAALSILLAAGCGSEENADGGCDDNSDCPNGEVCLLGSCTTTSSESNSDSNEEQPDNQTENNESSGEKNEDDLRDECLVDDDCGSEERCFNGECQPRIECESHSDCEEGFECVGGECFEEVCRGPNDCAEGEFCDGGECIEPPEVSRCQVATNDGFISEGEKIELQAFAFDENGDDVSARFEWSSSNPEIVSIDASGPFAVGQSATGSATLEAATAEEGVECEGSVELTRPGSVEGGDLRAIVRDWESGNAVEGATVLIDFHQREQPLEATTDGRGIGEVEIPSSLEGQSYDATVIAEDYNYVTIRDLSAEDLRIPLTAELGSNPVSGFTGEFDESSIGTSGDFLLGLAGASFPGGLLNLDLTRLLGEMFEAEVDVPGQEETQNVPVPGGVVMKGEFLGNSMNIKDRYYAATTPGNRLAWGLAGRIPSQDAINVFGGGIASILRAFDRFDHGLQPRQFEKHSPATSGDRLANYDAFPEIDLTPSVRQDLVTEIQLSNFPEIEAGTTADTAILVGGTLLNSFGFVPLGIGAATDQSGDGSPDPEQLPMAPPHGSATGGRFGAMALAFDNSDTESMSGLFEASLEQNISAAIWTGDTLDTTTQMGILPDYSEGSIDRGEGTITIERAHAGPVGRLRIVGAEKSWSIWQGLEERGDGVFEAKFQIPRYDALSGGFVESGGALAEDVSVLFEAIRAESVGPDQLVEPDEVGLRKLELVTTRFNRTNID